MDSVLAAAEKLLLRGKYARLLRLLEPQVFQYRDSYRFYLLLGYGCLYSGDFGGGYSYLRRAGQLSPGDTAVSLGLALVAAKRGETEEAVRIWLTLLEKRGELKEAERGLKLIRDAREDSEIVMKLEEGNLKAYLRYPRRRRRPWKLLLLLIPVIIMILFVLYRGSWNFFGATATRPELAGLDFYAEESAGPAGAGSYTLSEEEIRGTTDTILELMNQYRDNLARREINRLLLSNASDEIKKKARFLIAYQRAPSFATLKDSFSYREVISQPRLYEGCYVAWRGRSANILVEPNEIRLDLLVGYEDGTLLEGIVPVRVDFAVDIEENRRLELLGRLGLTERETGGKPLIVLEAVSIHQLVE